MNLQNLFVSYRAIQPKRSDDSWIARMPSYSVEALPLLDEYSKDSSDVEDSVSTQWVQSETPSIATNPLSNDNPTLQNLGKQVVTEGYKYLGTPYVWGGKNLKTGVDCSGFAYALYKQFGKEVPVSTQGWLHSGRQKLSPTEAQPGDVIITGSNTSPSGRHTRIITENLGNGKYKVIEAKGKKYGVVESTYNAGNDLLGIFRAKHGMKLKQY